jgi:hypothetical protein
LSKKSGPGFGLALEGAAKSDLVSPVGTQHSTGSYQIFENMNR